MINHDAQTDKLVYIRAIPTADLPAQVQEQTTAKELFSIHTADGTQVALVDGRKLAFAVARQHEMEPVSVH
ncbi:MAG: DUF1150 family protein [Pseudomonadota bacterium]